MYKLCTVVSAVSSFVGNPENLENLQHCRFKLTNVNSGIVDKNDVPCLKNRFYSLSMYVLPTPADEKPKPNYSRHLSSARAIPGIRHSI